MSKNLTNTNLVTETIKTFVPAETSAGTSQIDDAQIYESKQNVFIENTSAQSDSHKGTDIAFQASPYKSAVAQRQTNEIIDKQAHLQTVPEIPLPSTKTVLGDKGSEEIRILEGSKSTFRGADSFTTQTKDVKALIIPRQDAKPIDVSLPKHFESTGKSSAVQAGAQSTTPVTGTSQIVTSPEVLLTISDQTIPEGSTFTLGLGYTFLAQTIGDTFTADKYVISGLNPAIKVYNNNVLVSPINGTYKINASDLSNITCQLPPQFNQPVTFGANVQGHDSANVSLTSVTSTTTIQVTPVATLPTITLSGLVGGNISSNEGTTINIGGHVAASSAGQIGGVNAPWGTEVLTGTISGVPPSFNLFYNDGSNTPLTKNNNGDFIVDISKLAQIQLQTTAHYKGDFDLTFNVTSTEPSNNDSKTQTATIPISVAAVANGIASSFAAPITGTENSPPDVSDPAAAHAVVLVMNDPSETIQVLLNGVPPNSTFAATTGSSTPSYHNGSNSVQNGIDITGWGTITTVSGQTAWVMDSLQYSPEANSSADPGISLSVQTTEPSNNATSSTTTVHIPINIQAIALSPVITPLNGTAFSMNEDPAGINPAITNSTFLNNLGANLSVPLIHFTSALPTGDDNDTLTVQITGVPSGTTVAQYDSSGNYLGNAITTGGTLLLQNPSATGGDYYIKVLPAPYANGTFNLTIDSTATAQGTHILAGHGTATSSQTLSFNVAAVADPANLVLSSNSGTISFGQLLFVGEYTTIQTHFDFAVNASVTDNGTSDYTVGPEHITNVTISGLGSAVLADGFGTPLASTGPGTYSIATNSATFTQNFEILPSLGFTGSIQPLVSVTTTEPSNSSTYLTTQNFNVLVQNPQLVVTPHQTSISEGTTLQIPFVFDINTTAPVGDHITSIVFSGLPVGSTVSDSAGSSFISDGVPFSNIVRSSGSISIPISGTTTTSFTDTLTINPPLFYNGPINATVTTTLEDGTNTAQPSESANFSVNVIGVATPPNIGGAGGTYAFNQDPLINSPNNTFTLNIDSAGNTNESFSLLIENVPVNSYFLDPTSPGSIVSVGGSGTALLTPNNFPELFNATPNTLSNFQLQLITPPGFTTAGQNMTFTAIASIGSSTASSVLNHPVNLIVSPVSSANLTISNISATTATPITFESSISFVTTLNNPNGATPATYTLTGIPNNWVVEDSSGNNPVTINNGQADLSNYTTHILGTPDYYLTQFKLVPSGGTLDGTVLTSLALNLTDTASTLANPRTTAQSFNLFIDPPATQPLPESLLASNLDALASLAVPGAHPIDLMDNMPAVSASNIITLTNLAPGTTFYNFTPSGSLVAVAVANSSGTTILTGAELSNLYMTTPDSSQPIHFATNFFNSAGAHVTTNLVFDPSTNTLAQDTVAQTPLRATPSVTNEPTISNLSMTTPTPIDFQSIMSFVSQTTDGSTITAVKLTGIPVGYIVQDKNGANPVTIDLTSKIDLSSPTYTTHQTVDGQDIATTQLILVPTNISNSNSKIDVVIQDMTIQATTSNNIDSIQPFNFYIDPPEIPDKPSSLTGDLDGLADLAVPGSEGLDLIDYLSDVELSDTVFLSDLPPGVNFYNFDSEGNYTKIAETNSSGCTLLQGFQLNNLYATFPEKSGKIDFSTDVANGPTDMTHTDFVYDLDAHQLYQDTGTGLVDLSSHASSAIHMDSITFPTASSVHYEVNDLGYVQAVDHEQPNTTTSLDQSSQNNSPDQEQQIPTEAPIQPIEATEQIGTILEQQH